MPAEAAEATERPTAPTPAAPPRPWWRRLPWRHLPLLVLLGCYLDARIRILTGYALFTAPDTGSYAPRPWEPVEALSFTGHAPRPWGVPLLYSLVDTDPARVTLQWTISTLAWSLLACACWGRLRTLPARVLCAAALLFLALAGSVYTWDQAILSESLSISLGVATLALLTIWATTRSWVALGALVAVATWWAFTRQDVLPYLLLLVVALALHALRRRYRWGALVGAALLVGAVAWQVSIVPTIDASYRSWGTGLSLSDATFLYRLRFQVLNDPEVKAAYQQEFGMPRCKRAELLAETPFWAMGPFIEAYRNCPELMGWVATQKSTVGWRYARAHPDHYTEQVLKVLPVALDGTGGRYAQPVAGLPTVPEEVLFPNRHRVLPQAAGLFLGALGVGLLALLFRRSRWLAAAGALLALASTASAVAGMMYSAGEYARFGIQEAVLLRVGLILLAAAAIDAVLTCLTDGVTALRRHLRRRRERAAGPAGEPVPEPRGEPEDEPHREAEDEPVAEERVT
jgi:hypothetical protein